MSKSDPLPRRKLLLFAAPGIITSLLHGPKSGILPTIYAKYFGLDLAVIGTVLLVSKLFDAVTDPMIGYLSDRTRTRIGPRKPWIIAGYGLLLIATYHLFVPPESVGIVYFTTWFILFYLFLTMAEIPYSAWLIELSRDYTERTRIITYRQIFTMLGAVLLSAIPFLPVFPSSEYSPQVLEYIAWFIIILLPILVTAALLRVPQGRNVSTKNAQSVREILAAIRYNKPFLLLISTYLMFGLGFGIYNTVLFLYVDTYLLLGSAYPYILICASVASIVSMPLWLKVFNRFGKHTAWSAGSMAGALLMPCHLFFEPGSNMLIPLILLTVINFSILTSGTVASMAILGDVVDYDMMKTGINHSAQYFSFLTLCIKINGAIGGSAVFFILSLFSYDATLKAHDAMSVAGIKLAIGIPALFYFIAAILIWFFPINEKKHGIIRRRIESRAARQGTATD